jgi:hypothetical protein
MLAMVFLAALGLRSLVAGTASAQPSIPNPGHEWSAIALPAGTWPGLDADKVDGLHAADLLPPHGGRLISLGTQTTPPSSVAEFAMVDVSDCGQVTMMARSSKLLEAGLATNNPYTSPDGVIRMAAAYGMGATDPVDGVNTAWGVVEGQQRYLQARVSNNNSFTSTDITAWLWCAW